MILVGCFCASLRNITSSGATLRSLRTLYELALSCEDSVRTHRVLPTMIAMLSHPTPIIRAEAVHLTSRLVASVESLQPSDTRIMPDYVLPAVFRAAHDADEIVRCAHLPGLASHDLPRPPTTSHDLPLALQVRCALASSIASLASTSKRFLEIAQWMRVVSLRREPSSSAAVGRQRSTSSEGTAASLQSFDAELGALRAEVGHPPNEPRPSSQ